MNSPWLQVVYTANQLDLEWTTVTDTVQYEVELLATDSSSVTNQLLPSTQTSLVLTTLSLQQNQTYVARVRSHLANGNGPWSNPQPVLVLDLVAPTLTLSYTAPTLSAGWTNVTGVQAYDFYLYADDRTTLIAQEQVVPQNRPLTISSDLTVGSTYYGSVRAWTGNALGTLSAEQAVTILNLTTPAWLTPTYANTVLTVPWQASADATAYEFELWDTASPATRLFQQTVTAPGTQAVVQSNIAADQTYTARLRAQNGNAYSAWTEVQVVTLPLILQQLKDRLLQAYNADAQHQLQLNQSTIGTDYTSIIQLFSTYFGTDTIVFANLVPQNNQYIWSTADSVNLVGTTGTMLLGASNMGLAVIFEVANDTLRLTLQITPTTGWHFAQTFSFLAGTYFDSFALTTPLFVLSSDNHHDTQLAMDLQTGLNFHAGLTLSGEMALLLTIVSGVTQPLTISGPIIKDSIGTRIHLESAFPSIAFELGGIAPISMNTPRLYLDSVYIADSDQSQQLTSLQADIVLGGVTLPLSLQTPLDLKYWLLQLVPGRTVVVTSLSTLLSSLNSTNQLDIIPSDVTPLPGFSIYDLRIQFDYASKTFRALYLGISSLAIDPTTNQPVALWRIMPGLLELSKLQVELSIERSMLAPNQIDTSSTAVFGSIAGAFRIGSSIDLIGTITLPIGSGNWTLIAIADLANLDLSNFNQILGQTDIKSILPRALGDVAELNLASLAIEYNPSTRTIENLYLSIYTSDDWTIIANRLVISAPNMQLTIAQPLSQRIVTGYISGTLSIGDIAIDVSIERPDASLDWDMGVSTSAIILPSLAELTTFLGGQDAETFLPDGLANGRFIINYFDVSINLSTPSINTIDFELVSHDTWTLITNYLAVTDIAVSIGLDWTNGLNTDFSVGGLILLADVGFQVEATRSEGIWTISAELDDVLTVDLTKIDSVLLPANFNPPYDFGFPRGVQLNQASLVVILPDESVNLTALSTFDWTFTFAQATSLKIVGLAISLQIQKILADNTRPYTFTASGAFSFAGMNATLTFTTSNTGATDTVLIGKMTNNNTFSLPTLANTLITGTSTSITSWNAMLPSVPVNFAQDSGILSVDILINFTKNLFVLYGSSSLYGAIAFLTQKLADGTWGYFFALKLADTFTFASLLPELHIIDGILTFANGSASIAYASFSASSIQVLTAPIPQFSSALTISSTSTPATVVKGVNFYATLNFSSAARSTLFSNTGILLNGIQTRPDLELYGTIAKDETDTTNASLKVLFRASLGDFSVLDALDFKGVTFLYTLDQHAQITLSGMMQLTLYKGTPQTQIYPFQGSLVVNNLRADFTLTTPSQDQIMNPLGMTGVTITNLALRFSYIFQVGTTPATSTLQLAGTVNFGTSTRFDTTLSLIGSTPVLVEVSLTQTPPLGIIAFLAASIAGVSYPADYFDIQFLTGSVYYYNKSVDTNNLYANITPQLARVNGFNIQSTLSLFNRTVSIAINVQPTDVTVNGRVTQPAGVTASGQMLDAFDLNFIQFTNTDFAGSPSLFLRVLSTEKIFGLNIGFVFFKEHFATGSLSVGTHSTGASSEVQIGGTLAYAGNIDMFIGSMISFTYSNSEGFKITNWPFDFAALLDFAALMNGFKTGPCDALVGMVFEKAVQTKFSVSPSFSTTSTAYILTLKGTYAVSLIGTSSPFLQVSMPDIPISIDRTIPFTLSSLPGRIVQAIADSAPLIVDSILNNPAKFSAFIATVGLVNAAPSLIANLVCNGGEGAADAAAASAEAAAEAAASAEAAAAAATTAEAAAASAASAAAAAASASAAAAGAGGGAASAAAAAAAAAAATAAAAAAAAWLFPGGNSQTPPNTDAPQLDKAHIASFVYDSSTNQLVVSWQRVNNASTYRVELLSGSTTVASRNIDASILTVSFGVDTLSTGTYQVQIKAAANNYHGSVSDQASITASGTVTVTATANGNKIVANWNSIAAPAGYQITLYKDGNVSTMATGTATNVNFDPTGVGAYTVRVRALGDLQHVPGAWSNTSNTITQLATPTISTVVYNGTDTITVTWNAISNAGGYSVQLVRNGSAYGTATAISSPTLTTTTFPTTGLQDGSYQAQIMAAAANNQILASGWSVSTQSIIQLAAPIISQLSYANGAAIATVQTAMSGTQGYEAQFTDATNGTPVGSVIYTPATTPTVITLPDTNVPVANYRVRVRAVGQGTQTISSAWSISPTTVTTLGLVTISSITFANNSVTISWSASPAATAYAIELRNSLNQVVASAVAIPVQGTLVPPTTSVIPVPTVPKGIQYTGYVRITANTQQGAWSAGMQVLLLVSPVALQLSYANNIINANWTAVEGATGYTVEVHGTLPAQVQQASTSPVASGTAPATNLALLIQTLPKGFAYTGMVRALGANGLPAAWSVGVQIILLDPPLNLTLSYANDQVSAGWMSVPEADGYTLELLNAPTIPASTVSSTSTPTPTATIAVNTLAEGTYSGHVRSNKGNLSSTWGVAVSVIVHRPTPQQYAQQLHTQGDIAQVAAPKILTAFPTLLGTNPLQLISLLQQNFPESTTSATQLAWALANAPYTASVTAQALITHYQGTSTTLADIAAALKSAYPAPSVQQQVQQLQIAHSNAQDAALQIHTAHSDLTALQMGVLLARNFAATVQSPAQIGQVLKNAQYPANQVPPVLFAVFPLASLADIATALKQIFP